MAYTVVLGYILFMVVAWTSQRLISNVWLAALVAGLGGFFVSVVGNFIMAEQLESGGYSQVAAAIRGELLVKAIVHGLGTMLGTAVIREMTTRQSKRAQ